MTIGSRSLLILISFLKRLNSSPIINGNTLAMGWNSYSCCLGGSCLRWSSPAVEAVAGLLVSRVLILPSHQPSLATQPDIHSRAIGLSRRSSLAWEGRLALSFDKAWRG